MKEFLDYTQDLSVEEQIFIPRDYLFTSKKARFLEEVGDHSKGTNKFRKVGFKVYSGGNSRDHRWSVKWFH